VWHMYVGGGCRVGGWVMPVESLRGSDQAIPAEQEEVSVMVGPVPRI
jgi:hypothetical protein